MHFKKITEISRPETLTSKGIAIIPTGEVIRVRGIYSKNPTDNLEYIKKLKTIGGESGIDIYVPEDENLISVNYGFSRSHNPKQKAEMIFNALKNEAITDIYFTGGNGTEDVVLELENLLPLPIRTPKPNIYGMSDATHLLNYLGQKGVVNPYMMADSPEGLIKKLQVKHINNEVREVCEKKEIKTSVSGIGKNIENGVIIPCDLTREYNSPSQLKLIKGKVNFIADELRFSDDSSMMQMLLDGLIDKTSKKLKLRSEYNGQIVFCLSANPKPIEPVKDNYKNVKTGIIDKRGFEAFQKDNEQYKKSIEQWQTKEKEQKSFRKWCETIGIPVIENLKFGHQKEQRDILPLFATCQLQDGNLIINNKSCIDDRTEFTQLPEICFKNESQNHIIDRYNRSGGRFFFYNSIKPDENGVIEVKGLTNLQDIEIFLKEVGKLKIQGIKEIKITQIQGFEIAYDDKQAKDVIGYCLQTRKNLDRVKISVEKSHIKDVFYLEKNKIITKEQVKLENNNIADIIGIYRY